MSISLIPVVFLASHYADASYVVFYVLLGLTIAVWIDVLAVYILKKKGIMTTVTLGKKDDTKVEEESVEAIENDNDIEDSTLPEEKTTDVVEETSEEKLGVSDDEDTTPAEEKITGVVDDAKPTEEIVEEKEAITEAEEAIVADEADEVETTTDESGNVIKIQYISSFTAKLIRSSDELKKQYIELKKEILSYDSIKSKTTWHFETISQNKTVLLRFGIRGKTLCLYYALDYNDYVNSKYKVENVTSKKHSKASCLYRIKNDRRFEYAKELIGIMARKYHLEKGKEVTDDFYMPYEERDVLIEKGLIKKIETKVNS